MSLEEKDLLLKDLCARLPYGVKVSCNFSVYTFSGIHGFNLCVLSDDNENNAFTTAGIKYIKPYLFPMSSMTEEQNLEYLQTCMGGNSSVPTLASFDWLDKNHFDYRGLIPMCLAIDATELNIY